MNRPLTATTCSLALHVIACLLLAIYKFSAPVPAAEVAFETLFPDPPPQEEFTRVLDAVVDDVRLADQAGAAVATEMTSAQGAAVPNTQLAAAASLIDPLEPITLAEPAMPMLMDLGYDLGERQISGVAAARAEGYGEAMNRIAQEILRLMRQQDVTVAWLFDESESMSDDRAEISAQFQQVYEQLGVAQETGQVQRASREPLLSAVISFGGSVTPLTPRPTGNVPDIQAAIGRVKVDRSGQEKLFAALGATLSEYGQATLRARRKLMVVVVSDESGDDGEALESVVEQARAARAPVYFLSRESIFGFPYARQQWRDPETGITFPVQVRRGPETARPECLQYDGLHERWDAFSSGFGPYEMARLSRETGGIFFMLPGREERLRGAGSESDRFFESAAMLEYLPDLASRVDYERDRSRSPFRTALFDVIVALNPNLDDDLRIRESHYALSPEEFAAQGQESFRRAQRALGKLQSSLARLEAVSHLRAEERSQRWRAHYDLLVGQLLAYRVRLFQVMLATDQHAKQRPVPQQKETNEWTLRRVKSLLQPDPQQIAATGVDFEALERERNRATELLTAVAQEHTGTPWAARAQYELQQGFGMSFRESRTDPRYFDPAVRARVPSF